MVINILLIFVIIFIFYLNYNLFSLQESFIVKSSIEDLYNGKSGHISFNKELTNYSGEVTYGEVTFEGIDLLSKHFNEYGPLDNFKSDERVFYDLGCGIGKIVVKMAYLNPDIKSIGYEIVPERVAIAKEVLQKIDYDILKRVTIKEQDLFAPNLKLNNACWIFISNLCLKYEKLTNFSKKLEEETPNGCILICSKSMVFDEKSSFKKITEAPLPMSWEENSECIIYKKN